MFLPVQQHHQEAVRTFLHRLRQPSVRVPPAVDRFAAQTQAQTQLSFRGKDLLRILPARPFAIENCPRPPHPVIASPPNEGGMDARGVA